MELKSLISYKKAFGLLKLIVIVVIISAFGFCALIFLQSNETIRYLDNRVVILDDDGNIFKGAWVVDKQAREKQYGAQLKRVYKLWYQFDENSYIQNIEDATEILGECGQEMFSDYNDEQVFSKLREKSLRLDVKIIDVEVDMETSPVSGKIYGIQRISRLKSQLYRKLFVECYFYDVDVSEKNFLGIKIDGWRVFNLDEISKDEIQELWPN